MFEPGLATKDKNSPFFLSGNLVLVPLKRLLKLSMTSKSPTDQPSNLSVSIDSIITLNSSNVLVGSGGIPTVPTIPMVNS